MSTERDPYPTDVTDDEWAFAAPYLTLIREDADQRKHDLREVFNALRWLVGRQPVAAVAARLPALAGRLPAGPAVAGRRRVPGHGPRPPRGHPGGRRARTVPDGGRPGRADHPVHPRERAAGRVRRVQTTERVEGPRRGGHPGVA